MIVIGTLCLIVGCTSAPTYNGRTCQVISHRFTGQTQPMSPPYFVSGYRVRMADGEALGVQEKCLRPLAPPGDPDRVTTPVREPVEAFR